MNTFLRPQLFAFTAILVLISGVTLSAQQAAPGVLFEANQFQYPASVKYAAEIPGGKMFIEKNQVVYSFYSTADLQHIHEELEHNQRKTGHQVSTELVHCHAVKMSFVGASTQPAFMGNEEQAFHRNYFIGQDPSRWSSNVKMYGVLDIYEIYPGIDLHYYSVNGSLKYDVLVAPGADMNQFKMQYEGANQIHLENGKLVVTTSLNTLSELPPVAFQMINGVKTDVPVSFKLNGNIVQFELGPNYNPAYELVIDPVLVASTYSGTTATIYGHSATYDNQGNVYAGGRAFGAGYPVTVGAFDVTFGGGVDISISKYSSNGTTLLYATYIGGTMSDYVHSMVVSPSGELFTLGTSESADYPVTNGVVQSAFGGGFCDIVLSHLNPTGSTMLSSTFVGGTGQDGQNQIYQNYGDTYRGEINLDANGNVLVGSFTDSPNFPTTPGCLDNSHNGLQDGIVFRINPAYTTFQFSTYIGGTDNDATYAISELNGGTILISGGTSSANFPTTPGVYQTAQQGASDGWVAVLNTAGSALTASSYFGTAVYDQNFFSDSDNLGNIYLFGQTEGAITPSNGVYAQPGGGLYLVMLNANLTAITWQTTVGPAYLGNQYSPTAFLVDQCRKIYMANWGSTTGLQVSNNAIQPTTDGEDFYLLVLDEDAQSMLYGTYMGDQSGNWEHVDGGTARFDKQGIVYQAVCEGGTGFPTSPGAYSTTSNVGYDIVVFKIDFQQQGVIAQAAALPSASGCAPFNVTFDNLTQQGTSYIWDFGDGSPTSTAFEPSHTFTNPGTYTVTLIANNPQTCNINDTTYLTINVGAGAGVTAAFTYTLVNNCGTYTFVPDNTSIGAQVYTWDFGDGTATSSSFEPNHNYLGTGPYTVTLIVEDTVCFGSDTLTQIIQFNPNLPSILADFTYVQTPECGQSTVTLNNTSINGEAYTWNFGDGTTSSAMNPTHTYTQAGNYVITLTVVNNTCGTQDQLAVNITVAPGFDINIGPDGEICPGQPVTLNAGNIGTNFTWLHGPTTSNTVVNDPGLYVVQVEYNNCIATDSIVLIGLAIPAEIDTFLTCPDKVSVLHAGPGSNYLWSTGATTEAIPFTGEGVYWYEKEIGYCHYSDTIVAKFRHRSPDVFIPNSFTPNNDGMNDEFFVIGAEKEDFELRIFDRWGEQLFSTFNHTTGWNGSNRTTDIVLPLGTYVYKVQYRNSCKSDVIETEIGKINLIR